MRGEGGANEAPPAWPRRRPRPAPVVVVVAAAAAAAAASAPAVTATVFRERSASLCGPDDAFIPLRIDGLTCPCRVAVMVDALIPFSVFSADEERPGVLTVAAVPSLTPRDDGGDGRGGGGGEPPAAAAPAADNDTRRVPVPDLNNFFKVWNGVLRRTGASTLTVTLVPQRRRQAGDAPCRVTAQVTAEEIPPACPLSDIRVDAAGARGTPPGARLDRGAAGASAEAAASLAAAAVVTLGTGDAWGFVATQTGTLISPRHILTSIWELSASPTEVRFGPAATAAGDANRTVSAERRHPLSTLSGRVGVLELRDPAPAAIVELLFPSAPAPPRVVVNHNPQLPVAGSAARLAGVDADPTVREPWHWWIDGHHERGIPPRVTDVEVLPSAACADDPGRHYFNEIPEPVLCTEPTVGVAAAAAAAAVNCTACSRPADFGGPIYQIAAGPPDGKTPTLLLVGLVGPSHTCRRRGWRKADDGARARALVEDFPLRLSSFAGWIDAMVGAPTGAVLVDDGATTGGGRRAGASDGPAFGGFPRDVSSSSSDVAARVGIGAGVAVAALATVAAILSGAACWGATTSHRWWATCRRAQWTAEEVELMRDS